VHYIFDSEDKYKPLIDKGLAIHNNDGTVSLTKEGRAIYNKIT